MNNLIQIPKSPKLKNKMSELIGSNKTSQFPIYIFEQAHFFPIHDISCLPLKLKKYKITNNLHPCPGLSTYFSMQWIGRNFWFKSHYCHSSRLRNRTSLLSVTYLHEKSKKIKTNWLTFDAWGYLTINRWKLPNRQPNESSSS